MKHSLEKHSFHEIPPEEISMFGNLMGPQKDKFIIFLEVVTSHEAPRGKLHHKVLTKCFFKNFLCFQTSGDKDLVCSTLWIHIHKKRKDSLEARVVLLIFSLKLEISGVVVQRIHLKSKL